MRRFLALTAVALGMFNADALAQTPTPLTLKQVSTSADFQRAVLIVPDPSDSSRLFVVEQNSADIEIINYNEATDTYSVGGTFLDLTGTVATGGNEQGLLGMAFHPDYDSNGFFYVNYTATAGGGDTVVRRFTASSPTVANPASGVTVVGPINQPQSNHNGGMIAFGPDGKLYVGMGDGGNANDSGSGHVSGGNAQSGANLLGKMLRVNDDGSIPADNPFVGVGGFADSIYHYGLRNPWRFSFDMENGDMWIGDVGQFSIEEVDHVAYDAGSPVAGLNFGWRCKEGFSCTGLSGCTCADPMLEDPVIDYNHGGGRCSITGGYVYRANAIPDLDGQYFYADYCSDQTWTLDGPSASPVQRNGELEGSSGFTLNQITGFGQDLDGRVFIVQQNGAIYRVDNGTAFEGRGFAKEGTNGEPVLWGIGDLTSGSAGEINLKRAAGGALTVLFVSLAENPVPFKGGTLVTVPSIVDISLTTNGAGEISLPFVWPAGVPSGTELFFQYAISDAGATKNVALSNALKATSP